MLEEDLLLKYSIRWIFSKRDGIHEIKSLPKGEVRLSLDYITCVNVLEITSCCCSRVRALNRTAYPETRIVRFG